MINFSEPCRHHGQQSRISSLGLVGLLCLLFGSMQVVAAPEAELWTFWNSEDEQSQRQVDHSQWSGLLQTYLSHDRRGNALVDYKALKANDAAVLSRYIDELAAIDPRSLPKPQQMAYWINLYNALTVQLVVEAYPVDSIRSIEGGLFNTGPWDEQVVKVAGKALTLNDIEHRILRPIWQDKRIHYAVNCASIGCPNLASSAFEAATLDAQLDAAAKTFINQPKGVQVLEAGRYQLSSIYDWYAKDFGSTEALFRHLEDYHSSELRPGGKLPDDIEYEYDWALNDIRR